jgi:ribose transport system ATP-binding protein
MAKLLAMEGIVKSFYGVSVLNGVDFELEHGEVHVLLGENGAGKSTLMKILSGAYRLDEGAIRFEGENVDLAAYDPKKAEDLGIVTVYQNFHLIPHLSVAENLAMTRFTRERGFIRWKEVYAHAGAVLGKIDFAIDLRTRVRDLPVSQKQMLEIAIALSKNARILIMDEPTAALSRKETEILFGILADIKAQGIGIIYISHKLEEVKQIGDRITVLRDGRTVATLPARDADLQQIIGLMIGKDLAQNRQQHLAPTGDAFLQVDGLVSRRFPTALSLAVRKGEILGITGLVGAGKSELARAIFGIDRMREGTVQLQGNAVKVDTPRKAIGLGIGYLPEDRDADGLCLNMGVKENVSMVTLAKMKSLMFSVANEKRSVSDLVKSIGIKTAGLAQQVKYLSGGNKQKVVFGKWLSAKCNLLILDEPTIGIDVGARGEIYELIRQFVAEGERGVIFISGDVIEILDIADRILVMAGGNIVAELDPKHTTKQEILQYSLQANSGAKEQL